jgi:hypothetical protein
MSVIWSLSLSLSLSLMRGQRDNCITSNTGHRKYYIFNIESIYLCLSSINVDARLYFNFAVISPEVVREAD